MLHYRNASRKLENINCPDAGFGISTLTQKKKKKRRIFLLFLEASKIFTITIEMK